MPRKGRHPNPPKKTGPTPAAAPRPRADVAERLQARDAFVRSGRSLKQIAEAHNRAWATVHAWSAEEGWEDQRREFLMSDSGQADILGLKVREILIKLQEGTRELSGATANTILMAKRAEREIRGDKYNFTQLFAIVRTFLVHLRAADASLLPLLEPHIESFLQAQKEAMLPRGK